jgi:pimeloyl-ACP methyl ester carboxylesterase
MLKNVKSTNIMEEVRTCEISNGVKLFCKLLHGRNNGKTALYIHGGGSGGNHSMLVRPSKWMIEKGLFRNVILPDRRGAGNSSPMTAMMTFEDNARDMKALLDSLGITGKVTAMGVSYGGPIALTLAAMDPRIDEVILMASSPSLKPARGIMGYLYRHNKLEPMVRSVYKKLVGKNNVSDCVDFDAIYDAKNIGQLKQIFLEGIKSTPKDRLESLIFENASTCNLENQGISHDIRLKIPVYRVIGTKDETWEVNADSLYREQLPLMKTACVQGATHKDIFFRADEFYASLLAQLRDHSLSPSANEPINDEMVTSSMN